jgi:polyisoprenyl-teichoic acid--peptidoglycan teichoic acid transferase
VNEASPAPSRRGTARSLRRFLGGSALIVLLTGVATGTAVFEGISTIADAFNRGQLVKSKDLTPASAGAPQTIMIVGSDKRYLSKDVFDRTDPPHTDTILLVRMDPKAGAITVLSVPRDLLVPKFSFHGQTYVNQKINYAYTVGSLYGHSPTAGDDLALAVVKHALDDIQINDFVDLNFVTFTNVIGKLGCVYVNVDHRYFIPPDSGVSAIDLNPGYQPLCYDGALAYVRYRHEDSTFARDARQQDFLRQAKEQLGVTGLLSHYQQVLAGLGSSISTNIRGTLAVARLVQLAALSLDGPVRTVTFPNDPIPVETPNGIQADQTATPRRLRQVVDEFLSASPTEVHLALPPAPHRHTTRHGHHVTVTPTPPPAATGLTTTADTTRTQALTMAASVPFKVELPGLSFDWGSQIEGPYDYWSYHLKDTSGHEHAAYRITWEDTRDQLGSWYGIQGTDWTDPPLFRNADIAVRDGRRYMLVGDGHHIQDIGWIDLGALYWITNTIFDGLTNDQMLALAESSHAID